MLSIAKLGGSSGRSERYYIDSVADGLEDYYTGRGEAPGLWLGAGATQLGLTGTVEADELTQLLDGVRPWDGSRLRDVGDRSVTAFDLTFSAPKSVSILFGIGDAEIADATRAAHDAAVLQALDFIDREAGLTRRGSGGARRIHGDGIAVAAFRHRTSRAGDPQLHTHALVANLVCAEGRWGTLDGRALYGTVRTAGFLYQAALRDELTRELGVRWGPVTRGSAEILGIPRLAIGHFSRRRREIVERMAEVGGRSPQSAAVAALETRRSKDYSVPVDRLREEWRARAAEHGLDQAAIAELCDHPAEALSVAALDVQALTRRGKYVRPPQAVLRAHAEAARDGASIGEIERRTDETLASPEIVALGERDRIAIYTTREMLRIERELLAQADREDAQLGDTEPHVIDERSPIDRTSATSNVSSCAS